MVTFRDLESRLRTLRRICKSVIDPVSGAVDSSVITQQASELRTWISDFEVLYITEARNKPARAESIISKGKVFVEDAWFTYEVLIELSMKSGEPHPALVRWENLPSGNVSGNLKTQSIQQLDKLYKEFEEFKKLTLIS